MYETDLIFETVSLEIPVNSLISHAEMEWIRKQENI